MNSFDKKQLKANIIKFVIGVILLSMTWSYLQKHPAERVSVFSGFEVMIQKVEVFVQNTFGENGDLLERKYGMQKYYKELLKMAENNKCLSHETVVEIEQGYKNLKKENTDGLDEVLPDYTKKAYEFDNLVKDDNC